VSSTYYVTPSPRMPGRFDLRQARYAEQLRAGREHPHDLMATGFTGQDMRDLVAKHFPDTDLTALDTP